MIERYLVCAAVLLSILDGISGGAGAVIYLIAALLMENHPDYTSRYDNR